MVGGNFFFERPTDNDLTYKYIAQNRFDLFWNYVDSQTINSNLSQPLKNLLEKMICFLPGERKSIDIILGDDWMNGAIPSPEQIKIEFKDRQKLMHKAKYELISHHKHKTNANVVYEGHSAHRGIGKVIQTQQKKVREFTELPGFFTAKAYDLEPMFILSSVDKYVNERKGKELKIHKTYMKALFEITLLINEKLIFSAEVMKGEEWNYLVLEKREGDKVNFLKMFQEITQIIK